MQPNLLKYQPYKKPYTITWKSLGSIIEKKT